MDAVTDCLFVVQTKFSTSFFCCLNEFSSSCFRYLNWVVLFFCLNTFFLRFIYLLFLLLLWIHFCRLFCFYSLLQWGLSWPRSGSVLLTVSLTFNSIVSFGQQTFTRALLFKEGKGFCRKKLPFNVPLTPIASKKCVCMCVCERERERTSKVRGEINKKVREGEREFMGAKTHSFYLNGELARETQFEIFSRKWRWKVIGH